MFTSVHAQTFTMSVEASPAVSPGLTTYRFYVNMNDASDRMSAVFGNDQYPLAVSTPMGAFNSTFNASWSASGINPAFLPVFPELSDDTFATIGLEGPASASGLANAADPSIVEDSNQAVTPYFLTDGATDLLSNSITGASWYILNTASNGLPDENLQVLILQVTTAGSVTGTMNVQVFPLGIGADQQLLAWEFDGAGLYGAAEVEGCTVEQACNYNPDATIDDGSCDFESCFVFGCDDPEACNYDPTVQFNDGSCTYASFPFDCQGQCVNDVDGDGVCDELEIPGCTDPTACNFNSNATDEAGNCQYPSESYLDCNGQCLNDVDGDGLCDELEVSGCIDPTACNYNSAATGDDGSCEFETCTSEGCTDPGACNFNAAATLDDESCEYCSCQNEGTPYTLTVEGTPSAVAGMTSYRFYVNLPDEGDRMSAVFGNNDASLELYAPSGVYNSALNTSWNASGVNPAFVAVYPELVADTYATMGLEGPASASGLAGAADPSIVEDTEQPISPFFISEGATTLVSNTVTGASWYILNTASNGLADADGRVLIMQVTTAGNIQGQINYQVFPLGVGANQEQLSIGFVGTGTFGGYEAVVACGCTDPTAENFDAEATYDDGSCTYGTPGCTDSMACNYNMEATLDDGSCVFCDCGAPGTPGYTLLVESTPAVQAGLTTYRLSVEMVDGTDKLSAVYGDVLKPLAIYAPGGLYNSALNNSWNASGLSAAFVSTYPEMADDSFATIGLTGPASEAEAGAVNPDLAEWSQAVTTIESFFTTGGTLLDISSSVGGIWYVAGPAPNSIGGANGRVLVMQVTTSGPLFGTLNAQLFPQGSGSDEFTLTWTFGGTGAFEADGFGNACGCLDEDALNFDVNATYDDGSCEFGIVGCLDAMACNFDPAANLSDDSCEYPTEGFDCDGVCLNDADGDGVCDEFEVLGCTNSSACEYDPNATEDDGSCGITGCTYPDGINYNPEATNDDGSCTFDLGGGGSCPGDLDGSGVVQLNDLLDFLLYYGNACE